MPKTFNVSGTTGPTGTVGPIGIVGTPGISGNNGSSWAATYSTTATYVPSSYATSSTTSWSGVYNVYFPPVEIKFGFTIKFKNDKAKLIKLLDLDPKNEEERNKLKKIL